MLIATQEKSERKSEQNHPKPLRVPKAQTKSSSPVVKPMVQSVIKGPTAPRSHLQVDQGLIVTPRIDVKIVN